MKPAEPVKEIHAGKQMLVHRGLTAVIIRHRLKKKRKIAQLAKDSVHREGEPHRAIRKVFVLNFAVFEGARSIAV